MQALALELVSTVPHFLPAISASRRRVAATFHLFRREQWTPAERELTGNLLEHHPQVPCRFADVLLFFSSRVLTLLVLPSADPAGRAHRQLLKQFLSCFILVFFFAYLTAGLTGDLLSSSSCCSIGFCPLP